MKELVPTGKLHCHQFMWFPDGRRVCIGANEGAGGLRLYELDIETAVAEKPAEPKPKKNIEDSLMNAVEESTEE